MQRTTGAIAIITAAGVASLLSALSGGCDEKTAYPDAATDAAIDGRPAEAAVDSKTTDGPNQYCEVVKINTGPVQGVRQSKSCAYLSIPYAKPPVDGLRWKRSVPPDLWTKVLVADQPGKACFQWTDEYGPFHEDCLNLRIWTPHPQPKTPAPVLVWLNKGLGFSMGGVYHDLDVWAGGTTLAEEHGLVVVFVSWRLGALGFLAHPALGADSGNYGFLDQQDALKWVQDNISAFGGDPSNVTLYGSGIHGAQSVAVHLVSKTSTGFHRAIIESGIALQKWPGGQVGLLTRAQAEAQGLELAKAVGCDTAVDVADCLRNKSAPEIRDGIDKGYQLCDPFPLPGRVQWGPIIDGVNLEGQPGAMLAAGKVANKVPLIIGGCRDDATSLLQTMTVVDEAARKAAIQKCAVDAATADAVLKLYPITNYEPVPAGSKVSASAWALRGHLGDQFFTCPNRRAARHAAAAGMPVYLFQLSLEVSACNDLKFPCPPQAPEPFMGTSWLNFQVLAFHMPNDKPLPPPHWIWVFSPAEEALSQTVMGYWARFAKTGDPNDPTSGAVTWPEYDEITDQHLDFNTPPQAKSGLKKTECDFWDTIHAP